ncbi:AMIN-like domain-containing (lipo)protein [Polyangium fumosum]|uniref:AMIN-like domain-containing protein n=1 Tax=Polyangium fumosum TaxID=889272 RepID=A0A4U1JJ31_9BACT|nr:hypothetical protein [Polyangium fumosum]TKD12721.1 hypothetical protein E8A74_02940 [Polyangium fumosum]
MRTLFLFLLASPWLLACRDAAPDSTAPDSTKTPAASAVAPTTPTTAAPSPAEPPAKAAEPPSSAKPPEPTQGTKEPGDTAPEAFEGTAAPIEKKIPEVHTVELRSVRAGRHAGFDRVVFEFSGQALPGYRVEYIDKPVRLCGTGDTVTVAGEGWLRVRMTPARAHTDAGLPTLGPIERKPKLPVLLELAATCDFEGQLTWVLGVGSKNRYRVQELREPPRIVVDVRHARSSP